MHSLLEQYLKDVEAHLWALPRTRRAEELHELRQHLTFLVAADQERGKTETEAAQAALRQFGPPGKLGRQIARTWWRGRILGALGSAPAVSILAAVLLYLPNFLYHLLLPARVMAPGLILMHIAPPWMSMVWCAIIGGYVGWRLSRQAFVAAVGFMLAVAVLGNVFWQSLRWPAGQGVGLPSVSLLILPPVGFGAASHILLLQCAFTLMLIFPPALAVRVLARRSGASGA